MFAIYDALTVRDRSLGLRDVVTASIASVAVIESYIGKGTTTDDFFRTRYLYFIFRQPNETNITTTSSATDDSNVVFIYTTTMRKY